MTIYLQGKPVGVARSGLEYIPAGHNAFCILAETRPQPELSEAAAKRIYNRDAKRRQYDREAATRVNRCEPLCTKSDPHKQQRIQRAVI